MFRSFLYWISALIIRIICHLNGGLEVKGREHIPLDQGVILTPNHISYLDPPVLGSVLPKRGIFMAKAELFRNPVLSWLLKDAAFPVDRDKPRPSTIKEAVRRLKQGKLLVLFPEGTLSETGEFLEAKRGINTIAGISRAPVIPVYIEGTDTVLPTGVRWIRRGKISIAFGKPMYYNSSADSTCPTAYSTKEDIGGKIMEVIGDLKKAGWH